MSAIQIPGFEMLEELGSGGWATVWKARQVSLDRIVAIKVLSPRLAKDAGDVQRFQSEAQAAARLKHPGIVQVYDAGIEQGSYFLVMEYVAGYTVGEWIRRKKVLGEEDALLVADCVADALNYAWGASRIIHCDIKPDNVIIDADGTVKVADLGLARTISAMGAGAPQTEVMGTPAYMSPEQVRGDANVDCRSDIYAVGAMLYHMATGKMLFQGYPDDKIMEMQVTDTVADPVEVNTALSPALCALIEKMLAKNPDARQRDWTEVREDLARVRKGTAPRAPLLDGALSTVRRSPARRSAEAPTPAAPKPAVRARSAAPAASAPRVEAASPGRYVAAAVVILMGAVACAAVYQLMHEKKTQQQLVKAAPAVDPELVRERHARDMFEQAVRFVEEHADLFDEARVNFSRVAEQYRGTKYEILARERLATLAAARKARAEEIVKDLDQEAAPLADAQNFAAAAAVYERYNGALARDNQEARAAKARALRARLAEMEDAAKQQREAREAEFGKLLDGVAAAILSGGIEAGRDMVAARVEDPAFADKREELNGLRKLLTDATREKERLYDSFAAQQGQEVTVRLNKGTRDLVIDYIKEGRVYAKLPTDSATVRVNFDLADLTLTERLQRMGTDDRPDTALMKGCAALKGGAYSVAAHCFQCTTPLLSKRLAAYASTAGDKRLDTEAETALCHVMALMGAAVERYDGDAWLKTIKALKLTPETGEVVRKDLKNFEAGFGQTAFAQRAAPAIEAIHAAIAAATAPRPPVVLKTPSPPVRSREADREKPVREEVQNDRGARGERGGGRGPGGRRGGEGEGPGKGGRESVAPPPPRDGKADPLATAVEEF